MRLLPGLCSVTLRQLPAEEVLTLAEKAGLEAIEWGADVHAPPDRPQAAARLAERCADAGIACPSYGSYFFAGRSDPAELPALTEAAHALGAGLLRIWTPLGTESDAPPAERAAIAEALADACDQTAAAGLAIGLEFHPGTLTHSAASALALLEATARPDLRCYWQPESGASSEHSLAEYRGIRSRLAHLHVFAWKGQPPERLPLAEHADPWRQVLADAAAPDDFPGPRAAYLEFVRGDDPEQLQSDARTLRAWTRSGA